MCTDTKSNHEALKVSVIIPTYNRSFLILRAVHSVLNQTYSDLECIVVDDCSTDNTKQVIESIDDERLVYLRHNVNNHASAARNTGIKQAKGQLIAFLDSDDEWLPEKLAKQVQLIQSLPEKVGMVYCWMDYYDENFKVIKEHHPTLKGRVFSYLFDKQALGACSTLLVRSEVVRAVEGFDESLPRGNDGDFIRRVCLEYEVDFIPEMLVKYHVGHSGKRISDGDQQGIKNAIHGQLTKLEKFKDYISVYPKQFSSVYRIISRHYSQIGEVGNSFSFLLKSIRLRPFSLKLYKDILIILLNNFRKGLFNRKK